MAMDGSINTREPLAGPRGGCRWAWARAAMETVPCCSVRLQPAGGGIGAVIRARVERDGGAWRGSVNRVYHSLKQRQAARRKANARADHHAVISLGLQPPLHIGASCFIGLDQAQIHVPSAFAHLLQGQGDAGMDPLGVHARRQHGISEIHGLRLLAYEENTRHVSPPIPDSEG